MCISDHFQFQIVLHWQRRRRRSLKRSHRQMWKLTTIGRIFSSDIYTETNVFFFIYLFLKISKQAHLLNAMQFFNFCHFAYCTNDDRQIINERWKVTNNQAFSVGLAWLFQMEIASNAKYGIQKDLLCVQVCIGFGWSCRFKISHSDHNENMALKLKSCHLRTFSRCKTPHILALNYISPPNTHTHKRRDEQKMRIRQQRDRQSENSKEHILTHHTHENGSGHFRQSENLRDGFCLRAVSFERNMVLS